MKILNWIAYVLVVVGGLNWGLTAFDFNVVEKVFGEGSTLTMIVYVLVGLAAVLAIFTMRPSEKKAPTMQPVV